MKSMRCSILLLPTLVGVLVSMSGCTTAEPKSTNNLILKVPTLRLGQLKPSTTTAVVAKVINNNDESVEIIGFMASCGCTTAKDLPIAISPNSSAEVELTVSVPQSPQDAVSSIGYAVEYKLYTTDENCKTLEGLIVFDVIIDSDNSGSESKVANVPLPDPNS